MDYNGSFHEASPNNSVFSFAYRCGLAHYLIIIECSHNARKMYHTSHTMEVSVLDFITYTQKWLAIACEYAPACVHHCRLEYIHLSTVLKDVRTFCSLLFIIVTLLSDAQQKPFLMLGPRVVGLFYSVKTDKLEYLYVQHITVYFPPHHPL